MRLTIYANLLFVSHNNFCNFPQPTWILNYLQGTLFWRVTCLKLIILNNQKALTSPLLKLAFCKTQAYPLRQIFFLPNRNSFASVYSKKKEFITDGEKTESNLGHYFWEVAFIDLIIIKSLNLSVEDPEGPLITAEYC